MTDDFDPSCPKKFDTHLIQNVDSTEIQIPCILTDRVSKSFAWKAMDVPLWRADGTRVRDVFFPTTETCSSVYPPISDGVPGVALYVPTLTDQPWCGCNSDNGKDCDGGEGWVRIWTGTTIGYDTDDSRQQSSTSAANLPVHCWISIENNFYLEKYGNKKEIDWPCSWLVPPAVAAKVESEVPGGLLILPNVSLRLGPIFDKNLIRESRGYLKST